MSTTGPAGTNGNTQSNNVALTGDSGYAREQDEYLAWLVANAKENITFGASELGL